MSHLQEMLHRPSILLLGWSLVHFLWQGVLVALLVAATLRANRNASAQAKYAIAGTGLLVMLACPVVTFMVMRQAAGADDLSASFGDRPGFVQPVSASGGDAGPAFFAPMNIAGKLAELPRWIPAGRLLPLLVTIWIVGVAILAFRLVLGWLRISYVRTTAVPVNNRVISARLADLSRRMGIRSPVALLESALAPGPAVIGVLKPAILFPAAALTGLWPIQIEAILAHELAHVRRHDYLVNLLQSVVETLLFYHPAVWWVSRKIRQEREHCCDDLAVQACGDRTFYANCLADLDELRPGPMALAMGAAGGSGLLPRIRRILCLPTGENRAASAAAGTLVVAATGVAMMFLTAAPVASVSHDMQLIPAVNLSQAVTVPAMDVRTVHETNRSSETTEPMPVATPIGGTSANVPAAIHSPANPPVAPEFGIAESSVANGYSAPNAASHPSPMPPAAQPSAPVKIPFPNLNMGTVLGGGWLPRFSPQNLDSSDSPSSRARVSSRPPRSHATVTDFPPLSSQPEATVPPPNSTPTPAGPVTPRVAPAPTNPVATTPRNPRIFNYNGLLFVPDDYVLPQGSNFVIPQDSNYNTPQSANYNIPLYPNYVIPDRNYVAPRGQAGGAASIGGGRMSTSTGSGNYVRPQNNSK